MPYFGVPFGFIHNRQPKWAVGVPAVCSDEKRHFQPADYDLLEKERLAARRFGHMRNNVYKNVVQPPPSSLSYVPEEERLRTDVDGAVKLDHGKTQSRKKHQLIEENKETEAWMGRENEWARFLEHDTWVRTAHPHARVIANRTSVPYDPITLQYHDGYEGARAKYMDDAARWRAAMRAIWIYKKMNGDRKYDVISWEKLPNLGHPEKPTAPFPSCRAENKSPKETNESKLMLLMGIWFPRNKAQVSVATFTRGDDVHWAGCLGSMHDTLVVG
ncbi:hypothetical protein GOP47_0005255 [Adiantum capillus-veneris]|uniref:Uncharacterized protein n=1 Tax=Adiantum capillus-veneris TaxID=13818 RepID=A0A9D4V5N3_ADICA|nr:hypothetical protein GOP47_0005255 [Adiantum capillus-veneris]